MTSERPSNPGEPAVDISWIDAPRSGRRTRLLIGAAAAVVVLGVIIGVAVRLNTGTGTARPNDPVPIPTSATTGTPSPRVEPSASPPTTPTPTASPASSTPPATAPELEFRRVVFGNFSVELRDAKISGADGLLLRARVCVRKLPPDPQGNKTRISWDPWQVTTKAGVEHEPELFDGSHPPRDLFPRDKTYRVGACASGWIPFADVSELADVRAVRYRNGLGDVAVWRRS